MVTFAEEKQNTQKRSPKFSMGKLYMTPGAQEALVSADHSYFDFLSRHLLGDYGDVCPEDAALNDEAIDDGSRILSAYTLRDETKIWIITDAVDENGARYATTILLSDEY